MKVLYYIKLIQINLRNPLGNLETIIQNFHSIYRLFHKQETGPTLGGTVF